MSAVLGPDEAMARAVALAKLGPAHGPNPRVGAVIMTPDGRLLGEGFHRGAGTEHAEVAALGMARALGESVVGATAFVTLEPCNHTGRTGPCARALIDAGIATVVYAVDDPNPGAAGGAVTLSEAGVTVRRQPLDEASTVNRRWLIAMRRSRPYVIVKWASTIDGRTAAADGSSFWITGEQARAHVHAMRAEADAIVVGTGTILRDDPQLSARPEGVVDAHQPLRVVLGHRDTGGAQVWRDDNAVAIASHDPADALARLWELEVRTVIVEGGATVATAFIEAGLADELHVYVAPVLLGEGRASVDSLGIRSMEGALRGRTVRVEQLGSDVFMAVELGKDQ